jgi:hypothetical protein
MQGITRKLIKRNQAAQSNGPSGFVKQAGDNMTVATVVTRAAANKHRARRPTSLNGLTDRAACRLHQHRTGYAVRDGPSIGLPHLLAAQQEVRVRQRSRLTHGRARRQD